jgi:hypothetical protein
MKGAGVRRSGFRIQGLGLRVRNSGFMDSVLALEVQGLKFRVQGPGFWISSLGLRALGLGLRT